MDLLQRPTPSTTMPVSETTVGDAAKARLHYVDGLRTFAALTVILGHASQQVYWNVPQPDPYLTYTLFWVNGDCAVVAFIVLSGFCLMRPVILSGGLKGGTRRFYTGRCLRILPAYYAGLLASLLLVATLIGRKHDIMFDICLPVGKKSVISHLLMLQNLWPPPFFDNLGNVQINGVYWSVALECQIYLLFPLVVALWKRLGIAITMATIGIVSFSLFLLTRAPVGSLCWKGFNFQFYFYFAIGVLAAHLMYSDTAARIRRLPWKIIALVMIACYVKVNSLGAIPLFYNALPVELCAALMTLAVLLSGSQGGMKLLSWPPMARMGLFSYSIYLLHLPLLALVTDYVILPLRGKVANILLYLLLLAISLPLTLITSYLFASVFEDKKVLTRYWNRIFSSRTPRMPGR